MDLAVNDANPNDLKRRSAVRPERKLSPLRKSENKISRENFNRARNWQARKDENYKTEGDSFSRHSQYRQNLIESREADMKQQPDENEELDSVNDNVKKNSFSKGVTSDIKNNLEIASSPMGALSLLKYINFLGDMPFFAAGGVALLKDLLDPIFNVVLIGSLFSILCAIFIFMMMFIAGAGEKRNKAKGIIKKSFAIVAGSLVDAVPGLGIFPIETLTVAVVYALTLSQRRMDEKQRQAEEE